MLTNEKREELIGKIEALPTQIEELISGLTEEQLLTHFIPHEWTVAQNVHHLVDSHMNSVIRLKLILTEDQPPLKGYDQDAWADLADGNTLAIEDSLMILRGLHRRWVKVFRSLDEAQWQRTGLHSEIGLVTVEDLVQTYAQHGEDHIDQITRTLAAQHGEA